MMTDDKKSPAWFAGYAARIARGVKLEDNPYPEADLYDRDMWALGWREADFEEISHPRGTFSFSDVSVKIVTPEATIELSAVEPSDYKMERERSDYD
jgi:ribosome modulation factor